MRSSPHSERLEANETALAGKLGFDRLARALGAAAIVGMGAARREGAAARRRAGVGRRPGIAASRRGRGPASVSEDANNPRVYGWRGDAKSAAVGASSTTRPA